MLMNGNVLQCVCVCAAVLRAMADMWLLIKQHPCLPCFQFFLLVFDPFCMNGSYQRMQSLMSDFD